MRNNEIQVGGLMAFMIFACMVLAVVYGIGLLARVFMWGAGL